MQRVEKNKVVPDGAVQQNSKLLVKIKGFITYDGGFGTRRDEKEITLEEALGQNKKLTTLLDDNEESICSAPDFLDQLLKSLPEEYIKNSYSISSYSFWWRLPRYFPDNDPSLLVSFSHQLWWYAGYGIPAAAKFLIKNQVAEKTSLRLAAHNYDIHQDKIIDRVMIYKLGFFILGLFQHLGPEQPGNPQFFNPENLSNINQLLRWFPKILEEVVYYCSALDMGLWTAFPSYSSLKKATFGENTLLTLYVLDMVAQIETRVLCYLAEHKLPDSQLRYMHEVKSWLSDAHFITQPGRTIKYLRDLITIFPTPLIHIVYSYFSGDSEDNLNSIVPDSSSASPKEKTDFFAKKNQSPLPSQSVNTIIALPGS